MSISAKMIGTGRPMSIFIQLMSSVLRNARLNSKEYVRRSKFSRPIHALPQIPCAIRYFLKAMMIPYIGR